MGMISHKIYEGLMFTRKPRKSRNSYGSGSGNTKGRKRTSEKMYPLSVEDIDVTAAPLLVLWPSSCIKANVPTNTCLGYLVNFHGENVPEGYQGFWDATLGRIAGITKEQANAHNDYLDDSLLQHMAKCQQGDVVALYVDHSSSATGVTTFNSRFVAYPRFGTKYGQFDYFPPATNIGLTFEFKTNKAIQNECKQNGKILTACKCKFAQNQHKRIK